MSTVRTKKPGARQPWDDARIGRELWKRFRGNTSRMAKELPGGLTAALCVRHGSVDDGLRFYGYLPGESFENATPEDLLLALRDVRRNDGTLAERHVRWHHTVLFIRLEEEYGTYEEALKHAGFSPNVEERPKEYCKDFWVDPTDILLGCSLSRDTRLRQQGFTFPCPAWFQLGAPRLMNVSVSVAEAAGLFRRRYERCSETFREHYPDPWILQAHLWEEVFLNALGRSVELVDGFPICTFGLDLEIHGLPDCPPEDYFTVIDAALRSLTLLFVFFERRIDTPLQGTCLNEQENFLLVSKVEARKKRRGIRSYRLHLNPQFFAPHLARVFRPDWWTDQHRTIVAAGLYRPLPNCFGVATDTRERVILSYLRHTQGERETHLQIPVTILGQLLQFPKRLRAYVEQSSVHAQACFEGWLPGLQQSWDSLRSYGTAIQGHRTYLNVTLGPESDNQGHRQ